jgi:hypothetical protein
MLAAGSSGVLTPGEGLANASRTKICTLYAPDFRRLERRPFNSLKIHRESGVPTRIRTLDPRFLTVALLSRLVLVSY